MRKGVVLILLLVVLFQSNCSKVDDSVKYTDFLGTESYFKSFDSVVPQKLYDAVKYYRDSISVYPDGYNYFKLKEESYPFANDLEGNFIVHQKPFMDYSGSTSAEATGIEMKINFYNQRNGILSSEMQIDTLLPTQSAEIVQKLNVKYETDTMYVVTDSGDGYFMMYGFINCKVERANIIEETMETVGQSHNFEYTSVAVVVGQRKITDTTDVIKRIAVFDCIVDKGNTPYKEGDIKAIADDDDISSLFN